MPPSAICGANDGGFDGLSRMRNSFKMERRNSLDQTGEEPSNLRGSLTPNLNYYPMMPVNDMNNNMFTSVSGPKNMNAYMTYNKYPGFMGEPEVELY